MKKYPVRIDPCPIVDVTMAINFQSSITDDAVFGMLYNELKDFYKNEVEKLPILSLPEFIRNTDPNLKKQPFYRVSNEDFIINIGPKIITLGIVEKYNGWESFKLEIQRVIKSLEKTKIIFNIERVGLRYIDFFEKINIFDNLDLEIKFPTNISSRNKDFFNTTVKTVFSDSDIEQLLQVSNEFSMSNSNNQIKNGSIIDIDTNILDVNTKNLNDISLLLEKAHNRQKELFFDLITSNFLEKLNPIYED